MDKRGLYRSIDRWPTFDPLRLALVGNTPLVEVLDELRVLERAEVVWRTKRAVTILDADLRLNDYTLREEVNRLDGELIERVNIYEKTEEWPRWYAAWQCKNGDEHAGAPRRAISRHGPR